MACFPTGFKGVYVPVLQFTGVNKVKIFLGPSPIFLKIVNFEFDIIEYPTRLDRRPSAED